MCIEVCKGQRYFQMFVQLPEKVTFKSWYLMLERNTNIKEQHGMYNQIFSVFTLNSGLIDNLNVYTPVGNSVTSSH